LNNISRPNINWENKFEETKGVLTVTVKEKPMAARLWVADAPKSRDFRLPTIGRVWKSTTLKETSDGVYKVEVPNPSQGFRSYLVEFKYKSSTIAPMTFSTSAFVVPNKFPCGPPSK
jgi:PhoPQ-activated pathogenicity-related protein